MVLEVGKTWAEADADTAEAIDFLRVLRPRERCATPATQPLTPHARRAERARLHAARRRRRDPALELPAGDHGRHDDARRIVTGNTVVLKPSRDSPSIAAQFFELLEEAGLPPGVVNFVTGGGREVGDALVEHPEDALRLLHRLEGGRPAHQREGRRSRSPGQIWIKRVVAEMGGKDAIIVDETADLDAAPPAASSAAAFGFQGQKCSACSRAIVDAGGLRRRSSRSWWRRRRRSARRADRATRRTQVGPVVNAERR